MEPRKEEEEEEEEFPNGNSSFIKAGFWDCVATYIADSLFSLIS
jgi:hypothetical protein